MGNLFGKKKVSRVTEQDKAVLQLKQQRDQLKQYQKRVELQLGKDKQTAKQLLAKGNKDKAKLLLRKKKYQESLLEKTDKTLENIERMTHDLEFAQIEVQVVQGLKIGNDALHKLHQLMSIEDVERIMGETQEAVDYQREIDEVLAGGLTAEDEDDVLKELEDIIQETSVAGDKDIVAAAGREQVLPSLPSVPNDELLPHSRTHQLADKSDKKQKVLLES